MRDLFFMLAVIAVGFLFLSGCGRQTDVVRGPQGSGCSVSQDAEKVLVVCENGTTAVVPIVHDGKDGKNGLDATQISIVQFCPGVTPHYPDTFPEVGFFIDGKMFAVYSKNDGFLTYLPPGRYNSKAVGSSCDFTLNSDGTVSP